MIRKKIFFLLISLTCLYSFNGTTNKLYAKTKGDTKMTLTSTAFTDGGMIPRDYTCDGKNISPHLAWTNVPEGTKSLAIICDDPDAPAGTWVHWVLFNIPATVNELPQNIPTVKILDNGARHGINDFQKFGYGGPCPPSGTHRYYFKLYALDVKLMQQPSITKAELLKAMQDHIVAKAQLMGKYKR